MRLPKYKQHEKMGEGDPLRMAGLPMQSKGGLGKTKRNKGIYKKKQNDRLLRNLSPEERMYLPLGDILQAKKF